MLLHLANLTAQERLGCKTSLYLVANFFTDPLAMCHGPQFENQ